MNVEIQEIMRISDHQERKNALYEYIYELLESKSYYPIFGMKLYITGEETVRHSKMEEVFEFMEKKGFKIHFYEYEKPKIHDGKVFSYVCNFSARERSND